MDYIGDPKHIQPHVILIKQQVFWTLKTCESHGGSLSSNLGELYHGSGHWNILVGGWAYG